MKKFLIIAISLLAYNVSFSQFGDDVTIFPSSFIQKNVEFSTAFNGWVFSAVSFEDVANNKGGISIRKSMDGGETWVEIDSYSSLNQRYTAHDIVVTGTELSSLTVSVVGVLKNLTIESYTLYCDRYNGATGSFIGAILNKNVGNNPIYDVEIESDYLLPGVGVSPYSVAILYSRYGSSQDSINSIVSVDGGVTYSIYQNVSVTSGYFRNLSLSFGKSSSGSNGRYFAAWENLPSSNSRNGDIYFSRNTTNVTAAWIAPKNLTDMSSGMQYLCRNPRIATQFTNIDNDSSGTTALITFERDYLGDGTDYDVLGFYNKRSHYTSFWNRFDLRNDVSNTFNGDLVFDKTNNNFHAVYFDSVDFKLKYMRNDFQFYSPDSWTFVSSSINDTVSLTRNPLPRLEWNYYSSDLSVAWIDNRVLGSGTNAKFDSEGFLHHAGLENLASNDYMVFPNPSSGKFTISTNEKIVSISAYNLLGEKSEIVKTGNETYSIESKGVYFLQMELVDGTTLVQKIAIE